MNDIVNRARERATLAQLYPASLAGRDSWINKRALAGRSSDAGRSEGGGRLALFVASRRDVV